MEERAVKRRVVVVGAGNAALCAALAAREEGVAVTVLERAPRAERGGNSRFTMAAMRFAYDGLDDLREVAGGLTEEEVEASDFGTYPARRFIEDLERTGGGQANPELVETLVGESRRTLRWMRGQGVEFVPLYAGQAFEVDGVFDQHTAGAVRQWQRESGQHVDGMVSATDVLFVAGPSVIGSWEQGIELGQELEAGRTLASLTVVETPAQDGMSTTQRVAANLPLSDRDLVSVGVAVNVELPDDTDVAGTVTAINPSPLLDAQTGENVVEVTILLSAPASDVWIGATVTVEITQTLIPDALVLPATALLALVEGGSAVEVLDANGSVRLVGVETGLFVDGDVEVISPELEAGMRIVVPR